MACLNGIRLDRIGSTVTSDVSRRLIAAPAIRRSAGRPAGRSAWACQLANNGWCVAVANNQRPGLPPRQKDDVSFRENRQAETSLNRVSAVRGDKSQKIPDLRFAFVFVGWPEDSEMKEGRGRKCLISAARSWELGEAAGRCFLPGRRTSLAQEMMLHIDYSVTGGPLGCASSHGELAIRPS